MFSDFVRTHDVRLRIEDFAKMSLQASVFTFWQNLHKKAVFGWIVDPSEKERSRSCWLSNTDDFR